VPAPLRNEPNGAEADRTAAAVAAAIPQRKRTVATLPSQSSFVDNAFPDERIKGNARGGKDSESHSAEEDVSEGQRRRGRQAAIDPIVEGIWRLRQDYLRRGGSDAGTCFFVFFWPWW
jgi:hypothetical protein